MDPDILGLDLDVAKDYPFEFIIREIYARADESGSITLKFGRYRAEVLGGQIGGVRDSITLRKLKKKEGTPEDILRSVVDDARK